MDGRKKKERKKLSSGFRKIITAKGSTFFFPTTMSLPSANATSTRQREALACALGAVHYCW
jgi:hypothetical protein